MRFVILAIVLVKIGILIGIMCTYDKHVIVPHLIVKYFQRNVTNEDSVGLTSNNSQKLQVNQYENQINETTSQTSLDKHSQSINHKDVVTLHMESQTENWISSTLHLELRSEDEDWTNKRNIYFVESAYRNILNVRQACAVESAAKHNPNLQVRVVITANDVNQSNPIMATLLSIENVKFKSIKIDEFLKDSPVENLVTTGLLANSSFPVAHASDIIRLLVLYKYGGYYFDLDCVLLKPIDKLKNFACAETRGVMSNGVMGFDRHHPFLKKCLDEVSTTFNGKMWAHNGPLLLTRILDSICGKVDEGCDGITLYNASYFYPLCWDKYMEFFQTNEPLKIVEKWNNSYGIHLWNALSASERVILGSGVPYELAVKEHCPRIYQTLVQWNITVY